MNATTRSLLLVCLSLGCVVSCGVEPGAGSSIEGVEQDLPAGQSVPGEEGAEGTTDPAQDEEPAVDDETTDPSGDDVPVDEDTTEPTEEPDDTSTTLDTGTCDEASALFVSCESPLPDGCEDSAPAECVLGTPSAVDGYCAYEAGASACDGGGPSRELYEWCAIEACLGGDYQSCVASHSANCVPQVCEDLDAAVGYCDGYGYDCAQRDPAEAACLLEVFEALESPCGLFIEEPLMCIGSIVSEWGWGSCHVQRCTGVSTFEDCYANLEILCSVAGF